MFDLNNKKYSTKNILEEEISDSLDNLEKTDIIISNLKFDDNQNKNSKVDK